MSSTHRAQRPDSGPFGMGRQGYLIVALIIAATALFAATRSTWVAMLVSAVVPPLIMFPLLYLLSGRGRQERPAHSGERGSGDAPDLLTFLAFTNPFMFFIVGALTRSPNDDRFRQLLQSGPYGLGQRGFVILALLMLLPLIFAFLIIAVTGQPLTHGAPHLPF